MSQISYTCRMEAVPARDLRNRTAEVLRRVEAGEELRTTLTDTTEDLPW